MNATTIPRADVESAAPTERQLIDREDAYREAIGDVPTLNDAIAAAERADLSRVNARPERKAKKPLTVVPGGFVGRSDDLFVLPLATFKAERGGT